MTVSTTVNKITQLGDGVTTNFSFPFAVRAGGQADIQVYVTTSAGVITQLTFGTQYTVSLNAAIAPNPTPVGGTITCSVAPANGASVTILRTMSLTQPTSLANQGTLYQPVLESVDDNQTLELQQIAELQGRAITVAVSDSAPSNLPPAAQRANLALVFDSSGNPAAGQIPASGVISSAMAPFVGAASISAAKALLGYGTMANENIGAVGRGIFDDGSGNARVQWTTSTVAVGQSPTINNHMTNYVCSGSLVFTLPKLTTTFDCYEICVFCVSGSVTLSPNATDNFPGLGGGVSTVLVQGQCARLSGNGVSAWQIFTGRIPGIGNSITKQRLTSGSAATYTTPAGARSLRIRMCGGGGGGAQAGSGNATAGGNSSFGSTTANGGGGGLAAGGPGAGGSGGTTGTGTEINRFSGAAGENGFLNGAGTGLTCSVLGGSSGFGMSGATTPANCGAGGRADGTTTGGVSTGGAGGGGEYVEFVIDNPAATYTYTVGGGGPGSGASIAGSAGLILVEERY